MIEYVSAETMDCVSKRNRHLARNEHVLVNGCARVGDAFSFSKPEPILHQGVHGPQIISRSNILGDALLLGSAAETRGGTFRLLGRNLLSEETHRDHVCPCGACSSRAAHGLCLSRELEASVPAVEYHSICERKVQYNVEENLQQA